MTEVYYEVVEGEQPDVTICAALYQGELRHNLTLLLNILNSSLGDTGMFTVTKCRISETFIPFSISITWTGLHPAIPETYFYIQ